MIRKQNIKHQHQTRTERVGTIQSQATNDRPLRSDHRLSSACCVL